MKKQNLGKQIFSLFLALTLVFGMLGSIPLPAKADEAVAQTKVLADELVGYNRITTKDFESRTNVRLGESFEIENGARTYYVGNYNGKNYLDIDVNFSGDASGNNFLRYMGNADMPKPDIYRSAFGVKMYQGADKKYHIGFIYQDEEQKATALADVVAYTYQISGPNSNINLKILTNITESAEDATKEVIDYQIYLNDKFVCEGTIVETAHNRMGLAASYPKENYKTMTVKMPGTIEDVFAGYTRITLDDYAKHEGSVTEAFMSKELGNGGGLKYNGTDPLTKFYMDLDVNFNGGTGKGANTLRLQASAKYTDNLAFYWHDATTLKVFRYTKDPKVIYDVCTISNVSDYGIAGPNDWFNIKLKTDVKIDESNSKLQKITFELWLNDHFVWSGALNEERADANRDYIYSSTDKTKGNTTGMISLRTPSPDVEDELKGYTEVNLGDYSAHAASAVGVVDMTSGANSRYQGNSFDKTYLNLDMNFNGMSGRGTANIRYMGSANWNDSYVLGFKNASTIHFSRYRTKDGKNDLEDIVNLNAATFGITNTEYFNVKLRTDITVDEVDNRKQTVHLQLWLNNILAWEGTIEEYRDGVNRNFLNFSTASDGKISIRAPKVQNELAGYTRVTIEDIDNLGATRTEEGTTYASGKSGEYVGGNFNKTYLDMDVQTSAGLFLTYLMSEKIDSNGKETIYGNDRYQFELSGTTLKITPVAAGAAGTAVSYDLSKSGYTAGEMFNLKIRTDIEPSGNGQNVLMQIWVNDQYVVTRVFAETTARTAKYMGIRGTGTGATIVRTPMVNVVREDVAYDLSKGVYLLTGADYFYVNGKKMPSGTILAAPNDYIVERVVDGKVADTKRVSLYYIGDVNLDGDAFVAGDSVYMDSHALQGIVNYGTPMRAAELAADINNDGKVTQADYDEIVYIRSNVEVADEVLSKYYTDSLTYDYLGGKDVMPIGGFYGYCGDATLTDEIYELIKDSGINLITYSLIDAASDANRLQQSLALAEKYGIGMFITDSSLNTVEKDENDDVTKNTTVTTAEELAALMEVYGAYDSFLGITIIDEPKGSANWANDTHNNPESKTNFSANNSKRYQYYEALAEALLPYANITGYINLHGSQSVDDGEFYEYVSQIGEDLDVLSFDTYLYFEDNTYPLLKLSRLSSYLESLDTVRQVAQEQGKPFWSYVQAGSDYRATPVEKVDEETGEKITIYDDAKSDEYYTEADTLWIVNTSLAYGAKGIQYFPLLQPDYFSYDKTSESGHDYDRNGVIGANGEANRNYAMVQKANKQIQAIDEVLMNSTSTGVVVTGTAQTDITIAASGREHSFTGILNKKNNTYTAMLGNVTSGNGGAMVGTFDYQGYEAYYVVNYDRTEGASQQISLSLNQNAKYRVVADAVTTSGEGNTITLTVPSGAGVLVVLETLHTHTYGDWTVITPATLAAAGEKQQVCICGNVVTEEIPALSNVESWNLTLGGDLSVNFVVDVHEDIADTAKIIVTVAGEENVYDAAEKISVNVAAAQMNDEITVQIVNGTDASTVKTYSVLKYAQYVLADESLSSYHQLVKEMLNYGGFAQLYFDYNGKNPVNAGLEGVGAEDVPADAAPEMAVTDEADSITFYGASLLFRNKIAVRYYFTGAITNVNAGDYAYTIGQKDGLSYVEIADINPQDLDNAIAVTVNETLTVSYSPMNYIVRMSTKGTENLQALMKAIYNYHLAAEVICPDAE